MVGMLCAGTHQSVGMKDKTKNLKAVKFGSPAKTGLENDSPPDFSQRVVKIGDSYSLVPMKNFEDYRPPLYEAVGGMMFFNADIERAAFNKLLEMWGINYLRSWSKKIPRYAVFSRDSLSAATDGYLRQVRIIDAKILEDIYNFSSDDLADLSQAVTVGELLWEFIEAEREYWNASGLGSSRLGFGAMLECAGVVRVWSRIWCSKFV